MTSPERLAELAAVARRLLDDVDRRAALDEGIGVLVAQEQSNGQTARRHLLDTHGLLGQDAEAARLVAIVNATAEGRADPDWQA